MAKAATAINDPVVMDIEVSVQPGDERRHQSKCPTARGVYASNPVDIMAVKIDIVRREIRFSRRSTGLRYVYRMPKKVATWIIKWDSGMKPKPSRLLLHESDLISQRPRTKVPAISRTKSKAQSTVKTKVKTPAAAKRTQASSVQRPQPTPDQLAQATGKKAA